MNSSCSPRSVLVCILFLTSTASCALAAETVDRWAPRDFTFVAKNPGDKPFAVQFSATVKAPDGRTFTQPGFFDGDGTWKVRVSANQPGAWSLVTHSDLPELNERRAAFTCASAIAPRTHGALRVDPAHPHHFIFEDGTRFFMLAYECDWLWAFDVGNPALPTTKRFLERIAAHGFNHVLLNVFAFDTGWRSGKTGDDDFGPPPISPWAGEIAAPQHDRLNLAFWQHYDRMMRALQERGIMAHIMLKVYNKKVRWPERGSAADDLFFRTIVARYSAFPNLVWDFSKEAHNEKDLAYKQGRLRFVREHDAYRHLTTVHDDDANNDAGAYDALTDFRTDQQHRELRPTILAQRARRAWPVANVEFGYEQGLGGPEDKTYRIAHTPEDFVARAWQVAMAGGYTAYYYTYTAWDVLRPDDTPKGYTYFKQLRAFFETTRYWELAPADNIASEGWALANPGHEYVVCLRQAKPFTLTLPASARGGLVGEWFNPLTSERAPAGSLRAGAQELQPPAAWNGNLAVLHVKLNAR
jgi:hypothetical protein